MSFKSKFKSFFSYKKIATSGLLLWLIVIVVFIVGWVMNLFKLVGMVDGGVTALLFIRALGLFVAPLGAILGLFV